MKLYWLLLGLFILVVAAYNADVFYSLVGALFVACAIKN